MVVPEEGHLLLEGTLGYEEACGPPDAYGLRVDVVVFVLEGLDVVLEAFVDLVVVEELVDRTIEAIFQVVIKLSLARSETEPPQQMRALLPFRLQRHVWRRRNGRADGQRG